MVIAHDFMENYGGAERVVEQMAKVFPDAPVVAILGRQAVARRMGLDGRFESVLRPRPRMLEHYRKLAPIMPLVVERHRLPPADLLLTSSYAFAHGFRTVDDAPQLSYCHSPLRFAWSMTDHYRDVWASSSPSRVAFGAFAAAMRAADHRMSRGVAEYLAPSANAARYVREAYGREAEVLGAPVDTERFRPLDGGDVEDFFLFTGRLVEPYKQPSIVIEAFRRLPHRLVVAGTGPELQRLKSIAPPNVEFVGHLEDADLVWHMQRCIAAIFPSHDDFGLIPVEVAACGRPTIAYGAGGALETVRPGVTGEFITSQTAEAVEAAVAGFEPENYESATIRAHAEQWSSARFRERLLSLARRCLEDSLAGGRDAGTTVAPS